MFKSVSNSLILRGVLALIVGIIALAWPGATILALVILFAVYAFMDAAFEGMRAFSSGKAGPVIGHLLLARPCSITARMVWSPSSRAMATDWRRRPTRSPESVTTS